jgi:Uma2 family endonuclease
MKVDVAAPLLRMVWPGGAEEIALEPLQGLWTEAQYLALTQHTNLLIEFTDGVIEVLPMPTRDHQAISRFLLFGLFAFIHKLGGTIFYAPLRVQIRPGKYREPDLLVLLDVQDPRNQNRYWLGADLVVEIVSEDDPERDTKVKVVDYAEAGIPEYWIVNPLDDTITVLVLTGESYEQHGVFQRGEQAVSKLLEGFSVSVDAVFDAS